MIYMKREVCILFSGGSDSSLAAALATSEFEHVTLVTCTFCHGFWFKKCLVSYNELADRYGPEKIRHVFINTNRYLRKLYLHDFLSTLKNFKHYHFIAGYCETCKLSMHLAVIAYCLKHNIAHVWEGANSESAQVFADQKSEVLDYFKDLYKHYGISFDAPVWGIKRTDRELKNKNVVQKANRKKERLIYSSQFSCFVDMPLHFWARFVMKKDVHTQLALKYYGSRRRLFEKMIEEELKANSR
jgi:7-cyano-7-deazaguanine synthase in queuosine biosynthesis